MKLIILAASLLAGVLFITGCFPERQPFAPEELETRRPKVAFIQPDDEAVAPPETAISVWFDETMNPATVESGVTLSLAVERLPWSHLKNIACIARSPLDPARKILGRSDRGVFTTQSPGGLWQFHSPLAQARMLKFYFDPQISGRIFAQTDSGLLKTENHGDAWRPATNGLPATVTISCFTQNPQNSAEIWLGTSQGLFHSDNSGDAWQPGSVLPQWTDQTMTQIACDPANPQRIWVTTLGRYAYLSTDAGANWEMKRGVTNRLPASRLYDVAISAGQVFVTTINAGVYKSMDSGENWVAINSGISDLNTRRFFQHPAASNRLFVATASELFVTETAGENWAPVSLPHSGENILELFLDSDSPARLGLTTNASVYFSNDLGATWTEQNEIDTASLQVRGSLQFETWRDELTFVTEEGDSLIIAPHREDDALAAYDAGLISDPPVDPHPTATKLIFKPAEPLWPGWLYQVKVAGAFDGGAWQPETGVKDMQGNSLEFDQIQYFEVKTK